MELAPYQIRIPFAEIRPGDFLDIIEGCKMTGPRGGRYRFDGVRVESRVESFERNDRGRLVVKTRRSPGFSLPGNLDELGLVTAIVRRKEAS